MQDPTRQISRPYFLLLLLSSEQEWSHQDSETMLHHPDSVEVLPLPHGYVPIQSADYPGLRLHFHFFLQKATPVPLQCTGQMADFQESDNSHRSVRFSLHGHSAARMMPASQDIRRSPSYPGFRYQFLFVPEVCTRLCIRQFFCYLPDLRNLPHPTCLLPLSK